MFRLRDFRGRDVSSGFFIILEPVIWNKRSAGARKPYVRHWGNVKTGSGDEKNIPETEVNVGSSWFPNIAAHMRAIQALYAAYSAKYVNRVEAAEEETTDADGTIAEQADRQDEFRADEICLKERYSCSAYSRSDGDRNGGPWEPEDDLTNMEGSEGFYDEQLDEAYRFTIKSVSNPGDAGDIASATFLHGWEKRSQYRGKTASTSWFWQILSSELGMHFWRRSGRFLSIDTMTPGISRQLTAIVLLHDSPMTRMVYEKPADGTTWEANQVTAPLCSQSKSRRDGRPRRMVEWPQEESKAQILLENCLISSMNENSSLRNLGKRSEGKWMQRI